MDSPLAESGIIGSSIGLAMNGMRPVPELQFEGFMGPAYDQLCSHAARSARGPRDYGSDDRTRCRMVVASTLRNFTPMPRSHLRPPTWIEVVMPATPYDAKGLLIASFEIQTR